MTSPGVHSTPGTERTAATPSLHDGAVKRRVDRRVDGRGVARRADVDAARALPLEGSARVDDPELDRAAVPLLELADPDLGPVGERVHVHGGGDVRRLTVEVRLQRVETDASPVVEAALEGAARRVVPGP